MSDFETVFFLYFLGICWNFVPFVDVGAQRSVIEIQKVHDQNHYEGGVTGFSIGFFTQYIKATMALYGAETWTLRAADQKYLESFEMWC